MPVLLTKSELFLLARLLGEHLQKHANVWDTESRQLLASIEEAIEAGDTKEGYEEYTKSVLEMFGVRPEADAIRSNWHGR